LAAEYLNSFAGHELILLADETSGEIGNIAGIRKIAITTDKVKDLIVDNTAEAVANCRDYGLYVARRFLPRARNYWLIDPNVVINMKSAAEFFEPFQQTDEDFITSYYHEVEGDWWSWSASMKPYSARVYQCFFPINRFSGSAIDLLYRSRLALRNQFKCRKKDGYTGMWPNDEAFVATTLSVKGLQCVDMKFIRNGLYAANEFSFEVPQSRSYIQECGFNGRLYYPVLQGEGFHNRLLNLLERAKTRGQMAAFLSTAETFNLAGQLLAECGEDAARTFSQSMIDASNASTTL
jgi:hypothetical protein